jgi:hypothetical protein
MSVVPTTFRRRRSTDRRIVVIATITVLAPSPALAYIDPGSGSYYVQLIAAGLGGMALVVRQLWSRIRYPSRRSRPDSSNDIPPPSERPDEPAPGEK